MDRVVCFIDILGFGATCAEDSTGALRLLANYQHILETKITDAQMHPPQSYGDASLQKLAQDITIDAFDTFLPFSDNIFITSDKPDQFMRQLSSFLLESFMLTGHVLMFPEDPSHPEKVTVKEVSLSKNGVNVTSVPENWHPLLFRGGLAFGEVHGIRSNGVSGGHLTPIPNLAGPAVVEAVKLEANGKGPRLFCSRKFVERAQDRRFIVPAPDLDLDELLWLAYPLDRTESTEHLFHAASPWFESAKNCWLAQRDKASVRCHYEGMMSLVARSLMAVCRARGVAEEGDLFVGRLLSENRIAQGLLRLT